MNNLPSTKTHVLVMTDHSKLFITKEQAEKIMVGLESGAKWIKVDGSFIREFIIAKIIGMSEYQEIQKIKQGDWQCKGCGQWIGKGKQCGNCYGI